MLCVCYSDDQGLVYKDAIFISTHKFVGGVETPGEQTFCVIDQFRCIEIQPETVHLSMRLCGLNHTYIHTYILFYFRG